MLTPTYCWPGPPFISGVICPTRPGVITNEHRKVRHWLRQLSAENRLTGQTRLLAVRLLLAADSLYLAENLIQTAVAVENPEPLALVLAATIKQRQGHDELAANFLEQARA